MGVVAGAGRGNSGYLSEKGEARTVWPEGSPCQPSLLSWLFHIEELGT